MVMPTGGIADVDAHPATPACARTAAKADEKLGIGNRPVRIGSWLTAVPHHESLDRMQRLWNSGGKAGDADHWSTTLAGRELAHEGAEIPEVIPNGFRRCDRAVERRRLVTLRETKLEPSRPGGPAARRVESVGDRGSRIIKRAERPAPIEMMLGSSTEYGDEDNGQENHRDRRQPNGKVSPRRHGYGRSASATSLAVVTQPKKVATL